MITANKGHVSRRMSLAALACGLLAFPGSSWAWGDEGHEAIGLIADHFLTPGVRQKVAALLATDGTQLTPNVGIASEATWADKFRDSDRRTTKVHYNGTHEWHFVDIELTGGNIDTACFGHPALPIGTPASQGPPKDCVVDKIEEFLLELKSPATTPEERRLALEFVLHFVGDVHQPLHASDDHDRGGNDKRASAKGIKANNLHHYWDTEFVKRLGATPQLVADSLLAQITVSRVSQWQTGVASDWAQESYGLAESEAYGRLPKPTKTGLYKLPDSYVSAATQTTGLQLSKAGVRLAQVLNTALATP